MKAALKEKEKSAKQREDRGPSVNPEELAELRSQVAALRDGLKQAKDDLEVPHGPLRYSFLLFNEHDNDYDSDYYVYALFCYVITI